MNQRLNQLPYKKIHLLYSLRGQNTFLQKRRASLSLLEEGMKFVQNLALKLARIRPNVLALTSFSIARSLFFIEGRRVKTDRESALCIRSNSWIFCFFLLFFFFVLDRRKLMLFPNFSGVFDFQRQRRKRNNSTGMNEEAGTTYSSTAD